ncbi:hypothetical protein ONZ45_g19308 [Pleurotus djamor]|nr:hypothetical protein ONZ45_g19308 [Pleurotus djamor]
MMPVTTNTNAQLVIDEQGRALRTLRNTHSAVACLSDEILARVFLVLKLEIELKWKAADRYPFGDQYTWMPVTVHVCQTWRKIALDVPRLWSFISIPSTSAREMVERSKGAPLQINLKLPSEYFSRDPIDYGNKELEFWNQVAQFVHPNKHRLQEIAVHAPHTTFMRLLSFIGAGFPSSVPSVRHALAPMLEVLEFRQDHHDLEKPVITRPLPFWTALPKLRTLFLLGSPLPKDPLPFMPELRRLEIAYPHDNLTFPVDVNWLLHSLKNTPNVEDVYLMNLHYSSATSPRKPISISLPQLRRMKLGPYTQIDTLTLFDFLSVRPLAFIECLYTLAPLHTSVDSDRLGRTLLKFAGSEHPQPTTGPRRERDLVEMVLSTRSRINIWIKRPGPSSSATDDRDVKHGTPIFHIELRSWVETPNYIIKAFPLARLIRLTLMHKMSMSDALRVLIWCDHVRVLELADSCNLDILAALLKPDDWENKGNGKGGGRASERSEEAEELHRRLSVALVPKLDHLVLRKVSFSSLTRADSEAPMLLMSLVKERSGITVTLLECEGIPSNLPAELKEVATINWDGEGCEPPLVEADHDSDSDVASDEANEDSEKDSSEVPSEEDNEFEEDEHEDDTGNSEAAADDEDHEDSEIDIG